MLKYILNGGPLMLALLALSILGLAVVLDRWKTFKIAIRDEGHGFNPGDVPDPTAPENITLPYGRGLMLMNAYMDRVEFSPAGNEVTMVKENR